jgi:hypothetical protein
LIEEQNFINIYFYLWFYIEITKNKLTLNISIKYLKNTNHPNKFLMMLKFWWLLFKFSWIKIFYKKFRLIILTYDDRSGLLVCKFTGGKVSPFFAFFLCTKFMFLIILVSEIFLRSTVRMILHQHSPAHVSRSWEVLSENLIFPTLQLTCFVCNENFVTENKKLYFIAWKNRCI